MSKAIYEKIAKGEQLSLQERVAFVEMMSRIENTDNMVRSWVRPGEQRIKKEALASIPHQGVTVRSVPSGSPITVTTSVAKVMDFSDSDVIGSFRWNSTQKAFELPKLNSAVLVTGYLQFAPNASGYRQASMRLLDSAGSEITARVLANCAPNGITNDTLSFAGVIWVPDEAAGTAKFLDVTAWQTSGGDLSVGGRVNIHNIDKDYR